MSWRVFHITCRQTPLHVGLAETVGKVLTVRSTVALLKYLPGASLIVTSLLQLSWSAEVLNVSVIAYLLAGTHYSTPELHWKLL